MSHYMNLKMTCWSVLIILGLTGCAAMQQQAGFSDVQGNIESRTGETVIWYQDDSTHTAFQSEIQSLLADTLTLNEAIYISLLNNQKLQAEYEALGVAYADLVQAGLWRNPSFKAHVGYPVEEDHDPDLAFGLSFNFLDLFHMPLRKTIAASALNEAQLSLTGLVLLHTNEVVRAYYSVLAAEQTYEMLTQVALASEATAASARLLREAGNIRAVDRYSEEAFYEQNRIELAQAALKVTESRELLNQLLGLWGDHTTWQTGERLIDPENVMPDLTDIEQQAITASLDLELAAAQLETYGHRAGLINATALLPSMELGVDAEREGAWEVGPEFAFPLPLFDQGQAKQAAATAEVRRHQAQYYALGVEIRSVARLTAKQLATAYQTAKHYRNVILPLQVQIASETQTQFNAMQLGVFQLIAARRQEVVAGKNYIQALAHYQMVRANYELLLQGKLPGKIESLKTHSMPAMPAQSGGGH